MAFRGYIPEETGYQPRPSRFQGYTNPLGFSGGIDYNYNWGSPEWQRWFETLKQQGVDKLAQEPGQFGGAATLPSTYDPESQETALTRPSNQIGTPALRGLRAATRGRRYGLR